MRTLTGQQTLEQAEALRLADTIVRRAAEKVSENEQIARRNPAVYGGLAAPLVFNIGFDNSKSSTTCGTYKESAGPNSTYVFAPKERAEFV